MRQIEAVIPPFHQGLFWPREYPIPFFGCRDQPLFAKIIGNLHALSYTFGGRSGAIASVFGGSGSEKVVGYCFLTCSKTVIDQNKSAEGRLGRPKAPEDPLVSPAHWSFCTLPRIVCTISKRINSN